MPSVVKQLQLLWGEKMIRILFSVLLEYVETNQQTELGSPKQSKTGFTISI